MCEAAFESVESALVNRNVISNQPSFNVISLIRITCAQQLSNTLEFPFLFVPRGPVSLVLSIE